MDEVWMDIFGYEGMYQVSDGGHIRSLRYATSQGLRQRETPAQKQTRKDRLGYEIVNLGRNGGTKTYRVHQLVAKAFLPAPPRRGCVLRHVDGNKDNNRPSNLAWGSQRDNIEDSRRHGVLKGAAVIGFFDDGSVRIYDYVAHAADDGFNPSSIFACMAGRQNTHGGAVWMRLGVESFAIALRARLKAERERCAKVCEAERIDVLASEDISYNVATRHCAEAIRNLGDE